MRPPQLAAHLPQEFIARLAQIARTQRTRVTPPAGSTNREHGQGALPAGGDEERLVRHPVDRIDHEVEARGQQRGGRGGREELELRLHPATGVDQRDAFGEHGDLWAADLAVERRQLPVQLLREQSDLDQIDDLAAWLRCGPLLS